MKHGADRDFANWLPSRACEPRAILFVCALAGAGWEPNGITPTTHPPVVSKAGGRKAGLCH